MDPGKSLEVEHHGYLVAFRVSANLEPLSYSVARSDGAAVAFGTKLPLRSLFDRALQDSGVVSSGHLADAVPLAYRQDARGRSARTDSDKAHLAHAFAARSTKARWQAALPARWSELFGRSVKTWRNDIAQLRAEGFLVQYDKPDGPWVESPKTLQLVFGSETEELAWFENRVDEAEAALSNPELASPLRTDYEKIIQDWYLGGVGQEHE